MITFRRCDSPQGGVRDVRKVCQLMEGCTAHGGSVQDFGEVWQLSGSVTAIREVYKILERYVSWWRGQMVMGEM